MSFSKFGKVQFRQSGLTSFCSITPHLKIFVFHFFTIYSLHKFSKTNSDEVAVKNSRAQEIK